VREALLLAAAYLVLIIGREASTRFRYVTVQEVTIKQKFAYTDDKLVFRCRSHARQL